MPSLNSYFMIEREVAGKLNTLKSDDVATAQASFAKVSALADSDVDDAAFPRAEVRRAIVSCEMQLIVAIAQTEGHPRRRELMTQATVNHLGQLPSAIGPLGAIYHAADGQAYTELSVEEINKLRQNPISVGGITPKFYYFAYDGTRLFLTNQEPATVEYVEYGDPGFSFLLLNALFDNEANKLKLPDEFAFALVCASIAMLAGKANGYSAEGAYYAGLLEQALNLQGIRQFKLDYKAVPNKKEQM